jgi:calcineurin-like phosphoesterase family protein
MIRGLYKFAERWSEFGSVYIVSDTHFDDPDRELMGYTISTEQHVDVIKHTVHKPDTLIHLGDVGNPEYLKLIRGYKVLIMGNHDESATRFKPYFDEIYEGPLIISRKLILSHEPVNVPWAFNIHGHDHNDSVFIDDRHLNVAANVINYDPVNLGKLIKDGLLSYAQDIHRITIDNAINKKGELLL